MAYSGFWLGSRMGAKRRLYLQTFTELTFSVSFHISKKISISFLTFSYDLKYALNSVKKFSSNFIIIGNFYCDIDKIKNFGFQSCDF